MASYILTRQVEWIFAQRAVSQRDHPDMVAQLTRGATSDELASLESYARVVAQRHEDIVTTFGSRVGGKIAQEFPDPPANAATLCTDVATRYREMEALIQDLRANPGRAVEPIVDKIGEIDAALGVPRSR